MSNEDLFCTFKLQQYFFCIPAVYVQEVIHYQQMTFVPMAPQEIKGLINLRGQIVTAIDLGIRLELSESQREQLPMNVVIRNGEHVFSLLVDEVGDVLSLDTKLLEAPPKNLQGVARELIQGVYKLQDRLLLVLNIGVLLKTQNPNP